MDEISLFLCNKKLFFKRRVPQISKEIDENKSMLEQIENKEGEQKIDSQECFFEEAYGEVEAE